MRDIGIKTAAGEVDRISPVLLEVMKERGVNGKKHIQEIVDNHGSVMTVIVTGKQGLS